jgi:predicted PurR-regulated permease PerM
VATIWRKDEAPEARRVEPQRPEGPAPDATPAAPPPGGWRAVNTYLLTGAALVIVIAGMRAAAEVLVPCLLALFLAVICAPLYQGMRRRGLPSAVAMLALVLVLLAAMLLLVGGVERAVVVLSGNLPKYLAAFFAQTDALGAWLGERGIELPEATLRDTVNPQILLRHAGTLASTLGDFLLTTFIVVVVAIFILLEGAVLPEKLRGLHGVSPDTWNRLSQIVADVRRYMFLKTVMNLLTGVLVALWLLATGVDFPIALGVLTFALNYIPNIGAVVAAVPGIILAFIEFGLGSAVVTSVAYVVINIGVSNGIEPRYLGDGLGLSPLVVILSVLFWGWVLGPMGMLLSVPLTTSVKIALESDEHTHWLALLMSARQHKRSGAARFAARLRRGLMSAARKRPGAG